MESTSSQYTPVSLDCLNIVTRNRLIKAGYHSMQEVYDLGYRGLLESNIIGAVAIWEVITRINEFGWKPWDDQPKSINRVHKDLTDWRRKSNAPLINKQSANNLGHRSVGVGPIRRSAMQPETRDYVEIIVRRGFRCISCNKVTEVGETEDPMGLQVEGFTWHDSIQTGTVDPYFVCVACAQDVEVVGKLVLELMGS